MHQESWFPGDFCAKPSEGHSGPNAVRSCFQNPCEYLCSRLHVQTASERRNAMDEKFFAGLHKGVLVHRLYLMAGTEVLDTSPANWQVTAIDDECVEFTNLNAQP